MKLLLKLSLIALVAAVQPVFALPTVPDGGATAGLAALSVGGLILVKNFLKKRS